MLTIHRIVHKVSGRSLHDSYNNENSKLLLSPIGPDFSQTELEDIKHQRRKLSSLRRKDKSKTDLQLAAGHGWVALAKYSIAYEDRPAHSRTEYLADALEAIALAEDVRERDRQALFDIILKDIHYISSSRRAREEILQKAMPAALNNKESFALRYLLQAAKKDELVVHVDGKLLKKRIAAAVEAASSVDTELFVSFFALLYGGSSSELIKIAKSIPSQELSNSYHYRREIELWQPSHRPDGGQRPSLSPVERNRDSGRKILINNIVTRLKPFVFAGIDVNDCRWTHSGYQVSHPIFLVCTPDGNPGLPVFLSHGIDMYGTEGFRACTTDTQSRSMPLITADVTEEMEPWEWNILDYCAWSGYPRNLGLLLKKGMDFKRRPQHGRGWTTLHWLIEGWPHDCSPESPTTPTHQTKSQGMPTTPWAVSPMEVPASDWEYKNCLILLINNGVNINVKAPVWGLEAGITAYTMAKMKGLNSLANLLLRLGADRTL